MFMMFWTTDPLLLILRRSLTRNMGLGGSVWWDQSLDVFSLILKEHLSILPWRLLTSSSSKELLLNELLIVNTGLVITLSLITSLLDFSKFVILANFRHTSDASYSSVPF